MIDMESRSVTCRAASIGFAFIATGCHVMSAPEDVVQMIIARYSTGSRFKPDDRECWVGSVILGYGQ